MKHLWSPWRMTYLENHEKEAGCVFCNAQAKEDGAANLIAFRGERAYVILNRYPYTSGHLMVVPLEHKPDLEQLDPGTRAEMMELTARCMSVLRAVYSPQAFNMGANIGEAAGAGVVGHFHIHIVPRWSGDTISCPRWGRRAYCRNPWKTHIEKSMIFFKSESGT
jgi:ATP adenylyltransferase